MSTEGSKDFWKSRGFWGAFGAAVLIILKWFVPDLPDYIDNDLIQTVINLPWENPIEALLALLALWGRIFAKDKIKSFGASIKGLFTKSNNE